MNLKYLYILPLLLIGTFSAQAQDPAPNVVENITWDLTDTKMTIRFDLTTPDNQDRSYDLVVKIQVPENIITPTAGITGHIAQRVGVGRVITWYYTTGGYTKRELEGDLKVMVEAINPNPPFSEGKTITEKPDVPDLSIQELPTKQASYAPGIVLGLLGAGAATFGGLENLTAFEDYRTYERFECAEGESFSPACWNETLDDANSRRVRAQILMGAGGALVVAGGALLLRTRAKRKAQSFTVLPNWDYNVVQGNVYGLDVGWRF